MQGGGKVRRRTAVDAVAWAVLGRHVLERGANGLLHGVVDGDVVGTAAQMPVQGQKARMLARTVVVILARTLARADQRVARGTVRRLLSAAAEIGVGQVHLREPGADAVGVDRGADMAGAGQREVLGPQTHRIGGARTDQRQRLDHLARRPRQDDRAGITQCHDDLARTVAHDDVAAVDAFDQAAARRLDQFHVAGGQCRHRRFPAHCATIRARL